MKDAVRKIEESFDPLSLALEPVEVKPKKTDITVGTVALLWCAARP